TRNSYRLTRLRRCAEEFRKRHGLRRVQRKVDVDGRRQPARLGSGDRRLVVEICDLGVEEFMNLDPLLATGCPQDIEDRPRLGKGRIDLVAKRQALWQLARSVLLLTVGDKKPFSQKRRILAVPIRRISVLVGIGGVLTAKESDDLPHHVRGG